ncbi:MAG: TetR/AcrR family transcriptional regulator [Pseudomonadota bacterium]
MPRCREFDIDHALDQALNAFWLKGYEATSMMDLMAAMGLSKSSFYECFGSKREALLAALRRYSEREMAETRRHFSADVPVAELLAAWVRHSIDPAACRPSQRCGCLIVNIAVELAPHDSEIEDAVRHHLDMLAAFLAETIQRGNAEGSIPVGLDPTHGADLLLNLVAGIQVLVKGGVEPHRLAAIIDVQLKCLFVTSD